MFVLELKKFLRSKSVAIGLLFILFTGFISIYIGKQFLQKQEESIAKTAVFQKEHISRNVRFHNADLGLLMYYLRFSYINKPTPLTALSIGQRDVNNSVQSLTIRNLENQKYDTDLYNPLSLLMGNMDFSFVLIYLFPLLIIAFSYNILSEEKEAQTLKMVYVQAKKPLSVIWQKIAIRAGAVYLVLFFILAYAWLALSIPLNAAFLYFILIAVLYVGFWFALCFCVISWHKNSGVNAISLLTCWIVFTIISAAAANNYLLYKYPVPEALSTVVSQREGYHEKWDMDKKLTLEPFFNLYPQFRKYEVPEEEFSWLWYYAMQQMGDEDAKEHAADLKTKLRLRDKVSNAISAFVPSLHVQQQLNTLSGSGLSNHLNFLDNTDRFHEKLRVYFYPKIFEPAAVNGENWEKWKVEYFEEEVKVNSTGLMMPLIIFISLLFYMGYINFRKPVY